MKLYEQIAMCWLIGWFVLFFPIHIAMDGNLFQGLINGCIGLLSVIMILWFGEKWEECK